MEEYRKLTPKIIRIKETPQEEEESDKSTYFEDTKTLPKVLF